MTTCTAAALAIANERQLDWLLEEVLGPAAPARPRAAARPWVAAAIVVLGAAVAFGAALLRREPAVAPVQDPVETIDWFECHGAAQIDLVPADVQNLRCFDFDDALMVHLPHFARLQRLDLSGTDVNDRGYSVALKITDAGLAHLAGLPDLRWLSLAGCHDVRGDGLRALEALPMLEHLDLTYTGVESPAIERLPELARLRELSLSSCMHFHGSSLAAVARIPGLRRLELRACTTLAAGDVVALARLTQLRHLDLRDCQGRFRGQRASFTMGGVQAEAPAMPAPVEDGIGITDASIAALGDLKLESLLLGGSESLTDGIGETLAKMTSLRELDLSNLPRTSDSLLAHVPAHLTALRLDGNHQFTDAGLRALPPLAQLQELGLGATPGLTDRGIVELLSRHQLEGLALGGVQKATKVGELFRRTLGDGLVDAVAAQTGLRRLDLQRTRIDGRALAQLARLPALEELDLTSSQLQAGSLRSLGTTPKLQRLVLVWVAGIDLDDLAALPTGLRQLDLYGTDLKVADIRAAKAWTGCTIKLPDGRIHRVPDTR